MIKMLKSFIFIASYFFCINAYSYKETTHQDLSQNAVYLSNIVIDESLLYDLGLKSFNSNEVFVDPDNVNGKKISIVELFRGGAKYEDRSNRALNHFYNPITNLPLPFIGALPAGSASPNWALEDNSDVDPELTGAQEYSYKDAMNYFHLALTSATIDERELNWAKTFQTLGQVIHHIQDMAQPDHARNDAHLDVVDSSWYEKFTDDEKGKDYFTSLMTGNAYPIPVFDTAREFWTTRDNDTDITLRRGIADFTNRNFVTKETMFKSNGGNFILNSDLPLPEPLATRNSADISDPSLMGQDGQALCDYIKNQASITFPVGTCNMEFLETTVYGATAGEVSTNARAATLSIFNKKLDDHNLTAELQDEDGSISYIDRSFTLNEFNFKARYDYLIPRAVAYSAGLINHFFRGKIDMVPNSDGEGWVIKNESDEDMDGVFKLYCDDVDTNRSELINASIATTVPLVAGGQLIFSGFDISTCGSSIMLIFKGKLGNEGESNINESFVITAKKLDLNLELKVFVAQTFKNILSNMSFCGPDQWKTYGLNKNVLIYWYIAYRGDREIKRWTVKLTYISNTTAPPTVNGTACGGGTIGTATVLREVILDNLDSVDLSPPSFNFQLANAGQSEDWSQEYMHNQSNIYTNQSNHFLLESDQGVVFHTFQSYDEASKGGTYASYTYGILSIVPVNVTIDFPDSGSGSTVSSPEISYSHSWTWQKNTIILQ